MSSAYSNPRTTTAAKNYYQTSLSTLVNGNDSLDENSNLMCYSDTDWYRIRHRTIAYKPFKYDLIDFVPVFVSLY